MPLTDFQVDIFKIIGSNRSDSSYVAGGTAIHSRENGARLSNDIDIFHDLDDAVKAAVFRDEQSLKNEGYEIEFLLKQSSLQQAIVKKNGQSIKVEWAQDSSFRFFPIVCDSVVGYRLHDADLSTNKVLACAGRSESRDFFDIIHFDENYLPLGALVWAACGKDEGYTPDFLINQLSRNSRFREQDFEKLELTHPINVKELKIKWIDCLERAKEFVKVMPPETIGSLFLINGKPVAPKIEDFSKCQIHNGCIRGAWPKLIPQ